MAATWGERLQRVDELQQQRDEAGGAGAGGRGDDLALHARGLVRAGREDDLVLDRLQALEARLELLPLGVVRAVERRRVEAGRARRARDGRPPSASGSVERGPLGGVHVVADELVGGVLVGHADVGRPGVGQELGRRRLGRRLAAARLVGPEVALAGSRPRAVSSSPASTSSSSPLRLSSSALMFLLPLSASAAVRRPRVAADRRLPGRVVAAKDAVALPEAAGVARRN